MYEKRMPQDMRHEFVDRVTNLTPRLSEVAKVGAVPDREWQGKYTDVADRYFTGMHEDTGIQGTSGVLRGYRVYAAAIAQVPFALLEHKPDYRKDNMALYDTLSRSLLPALGIVMGVNSDRNVELEKSLHLRGLPFNPEHSPGFEFTYTDDGLLYRAKSDLLIYKRGEIDEDEIAATGLSYEVLRSREGCAMPLEFHQRIWDAMVRTCVFDYNYINADIDEIRKTLLDTNSSRVQ